MPAGLVNYAFLVIQNFKHYRAATEWCTGWLVQSCLLSIMCRGAFLLEGIDVRGEAAGKGRIWTEYLWLLPWAERDTPSLETITHSPQLTSQRAIPLPWKCHPHPLMRSICGKYNYLPTLQRLDLAVEVLWPKQASQSFKINPGALSSCDTLSSRYCNPSRPCIIGAGAHIRPISTWSSPSIKTPHKSHLTTMIASLLPFLLRSVSKHQMNWPSNQAPRNNLKDEDICLQNIPSFFMVEHSKTLWYGLIFLSLPNKQSAVSLRVQMTAMPTHYSPFLPPTSPILPISPHSHSLSPRWPATSDGRHNSGCTRDMLPINRILISR